MRCRPAVLLGVAAVLVGAGCSSPDTDEAVPTTTPAPTTTAVDDEPSAELQAWASTFCTATAPSFDVAGKIDVSGAGDESLAGQRQFTVNLYDSFAESYDESASAMRTLDPPPIDLGEDFVSDASDAFTGAADSVRALGADAQAVDLTDPAASDQINVGLPTLGTQISEALASVTPPELEDVLKTVPECKALGG